MGSCKKTHTIRHFKIKNIYYIHHIIKITCLRVVNKTCINGTLNTTPCYVSLVVFWDLPFHLMIQLNHTYNPPKLTPRNKIQYVWALRRWSWDLQSTIWSAHSIILCHALMYEIVPHDLIHGSFKFLDTILVAWQLDLVTMFKIIHKICI